MRSSSLHHNNNDRDRDDHKDNTSTKSSASTTSTSSSSIWSPIRSLLFGSSLSSSSTSTTSVILPTLKQRWNRYRRQSKLAKKYGGNNNNNNNNNNGGNKDDINNAATALFSVLAINPPNAKTLIRMSQEYPSILIMNMNIQYSLSPLGTLGPSTLSYFKYSIKGDRTLSRFRLEFCPATASELAAGCKPIEPSLAICK